MSNDEQELTWKINNIREEISLDLKNLASKDVPAEQRKVIREHLAICNSSLKILKDLAASKRQVRSTTSDSHARRN